MNRYKIHNFKRTAIKEWPIENGRCEIDSVDDLFIVARQLKDTYGAKEVIPADDVHTQNFGWIFYGGSRHITVTMDIKKFKYIINDKYRETFRSERGKIDLCRKIHREILS